MAQLKQLLGNLKLSEKEVEIFLALVRMGKSPVSTISRESGITRTHVYGIVEGLVEKGLVSEIEERGVKTYEAVDHAGLLAFISREQKELQKIEKNIAEMASSFNAMQVGGKEKTKVRFFNGIDGVKNIYAEIRRDLEKQETSIEVLTIFSPENLEQIIPNFDYFNYPNMIGRDIVAEDAFIEQYKIKIKNGAYKVWTKEKGLFPTDSIQWKNKIAYIDVSGFPSGIIIENESMAKSFTMWFNEMWNGLQKNTA